MKIKIISAGAGSGKTFRLTQELVALLKSGQVRPSGIVATTFTNKAAAELHERVRMKLIEEGLGELANQLAQALIGTVHSLGVKLLQRFAFEAGISPQVDIIAEDDKSLLFSQATATVLTEDRVQRIEALAECMGMSTTEKFATDWRKLLANITDLARSYDMDSQALQSSKQRSIETLMAFLEPGDDTTAAHLAETLIDEAAWNDALLHTLEQTIQSIQSNDDSTKTTADALQQLQSLAQKCRREGQLTWPEWAKLSKTRVGKKSNVDARELLELAQAHYLHPRFRKDLTEFISLLFDFAIDALTEYDRYKKSRGLIDYTDMEVLVRRLLDEPQVQQVLSDELDLLLVDEFQDTNPMQLDIFMRLSRFAKLAIWVGDPKQSIYGFRGADPALIQAIIEDQGGIDPANIQKTSYRSRQALVDFSNFIFTRAFPQWPEEQVALEANRRASEEPPTTGHAIEYWLLKHPDGQRSETNDWLCTSIAWQLRQYLEHPPLIQPKGTKSWRPALPGDVAILCRTNSQCEYMAEALHRQGLRATIARAGLLDTAEGTLLTACLRYLLNRYDTLAVAEIWYLTKGGPIEEILDHRLQYVLENSEGPRQRWGTHLESVARLDALREQIPELSAAEVLTLILEELDLRSVIMRWGNASQRLANVEVLLRYALDYEEACHRMHQAASLGGFLLWLEDKCRQNADLQATDTDAHAIQVLTYHKSKGLEFPIVVCLSLWEKFRASVWGVNLVNEASSIDLSDPLAGRWIRLWVHPYGKQNQQTVLDDRVNASPAYELAAEQAREEEKRLLYVGFTRARDYLLLPASPRNPARWLNRVVEQDSENVDALEIAAEGQWAWKGRPIQVVKIEREVMPEQHLPGPQSETFLFFEPRRGKGSHLPAELSPEDWKTPIDLQPEEPYASQLPLPDEAWLADFTEALANFWRLCSPQHDLDELKTIALELLHQTDLEEPEAHAEAWARQAEAFFHRMEEKWPGFEYKLLLPVGMAHEGRHFRHTLDMLWMNGSEGVLVLHCFERTHGKSDSPVMKAEAARLLWCKMAASKQYALSRCVCFLHLPFEGRSMVVLSS